MQQVAEALDIVVVERRVDLVQHADRRRVGEEHRDDQGERGERLLAARQERQGRGLLARGLGQNVEAGFERIVALDQLQLGGAAAEQRGEQALTAMALIFAVFLTNPAPICVLDEVDAPLDDHNVDRFCDLLDEMAKSTETRFIIITHNPITMARMDRLFGVTMAERGVSQIVSVDLAAAERFLEAS